MGLREDAAHGCSARDRRTRRRTRRHTVLHRHAWKKKHLRYVQVATPPSRRLRTPRPGGTEHQATQGRATKSVRACGRDDDRAVGRLAVSGPGPARLQHADAGKWQLRWLHTNSRVHAVTTAPRLHNRPPVSDAQP